MNPKTVVYDIDDGSMYGPTNPGRDDGLVHEVAVLAVSCLNPCT